MASIATAPPRPTVRRAPAPAGLKARAADPAAGFEAAYQAASATRDPQVAKKSLEQMKSAFEALRAAGGRDLSAFQTKIDTIARRSAALPVLYGLPDIPKPQTLRNPASSAVAPSREQVAAAAALMEGYTAKSASAFSRLLAKLIPSKHQAVATPAFHQLSPERQAQFLTVARAADAAGQVALHDLLVSDRLSPALLKAAAELVSAPVASGIDRKKLLSQALVEVADPVTISQHGRGTCAATSVQILLALESPVAYFQALKGLASPSGATRLPGGAAIKREPDWDADNDGGRSLPSRLFQPAFMEYANGDLDYLNTEDMDLDPKTQQKALSGLTAEQAVNLLDATGLAKAGFETHGMLYAPGLSELVQQGLDATIEDGRDMLMVLQNGKVIDPKTQDAVMADLKAQASPKTPVYATVIYTLYPETGRVGFHAVLVTGVKDGKVSYINPWGQEEQLSETLFRTTILSANVAK